MHMESWISDDTSVMKLVFGYLSIYDIQRWRWTSSHRTKDTDVLVKTSWPEYVCSRVKAHRCGNCHRICQRRRMEHCGCCERIVCIDHLVHCAGCGTTGCEICVYRELCHECHMWPDDG